MKLKKLSALILAGIVLLSAGCTIAEESQDTDEEITEEVITADDIDGDEYYFIEPDIDDNGYWVDIRALDYVERIDFTGIEIPKDIHDVPDFILDAEIDRAIQQGTAELPQIFDRAVEDGDTVNIDFVGSIDGVEFPGGTTMGMGAPVTIGVTNYIDDFLEQLIGAMPGDTVNVNVMFPDNYHEESLQGAPALFITVINYIYDTTDFRDEVKSRLQKGAIYEFIQMEIIEGSDVRDDIPQSMIQVQENAMLDYYRGYAAQFGMGLEDFLMASGFESVDEFIDETKEENIKFAKYYLTMQAIAESMELTVSEQDLADYALEYMGVDDYTMMVPLSELPFFAQMVLQQKILDYLLEHVILL